MPNLEHDPQNPTDLLGRPIAPGDIVAWGTTYGRSAGLCIASIEKIRFVREVPGRGGYGTKRVECPQAMAEDYTLQLRPIKSTGDVTWVDKRQGDPRPSGSMYWPKQEDIDAEPDRYEAKLKTVHHVKNVVKLEPMGA